jgi:prevent-host-death family protein
MLGRVKRVTTHEAKTHLSRLLAEVEKGEEIIVCRGNTPVARLLPMSRKQVRRRPHVGTVTSEAVLIANDAFAPLTETELEVWGV